MSVEVTLTKIQFVYVGSVIETKRVKNIFIKNWKGKVVRTNAITTCRISFTTSSILLIDFDSIGEYPTASDRSRGDFPKPLGKTAITSEPL